MWLPQIDYFSNQYRTIAVDLRGFGKSSRSDQPLSIDLFVGDILALIEKLEIEKVNLIGLSMGGYVAQRFYQFYPEYVKRLILCNTRSQKDTPEGILKRHELIEFIKKGNFNSFVENFIKSSVHKNNLDRVYNVLCEVIQKNSQEIVCDSLICLANRPDTTNILAKIKVPTLLIGGKEDNLIPSEIMVEMHKVIPNSELVLFDKVGHFSNLESSSKFNSVINDFIAKTS